MGACPEDVKITWKCSEYSGLVVRNQSRQVTCYSSRGPTCYPWMKLDPQGTVCLDLFLVQMLLLSWAWHSSGLQEWLKDQPVEIYC